MDPIHMRLIGPFSCILALPPPLMQGPTRPWLDARPLPPRTGVGIPYRTQAWWPFPATLTAPCQTWRCRFEDVEAMHWTGPEDGGPKRKGGDGHRCPRLGVVS